MKKRFLPIGFFSFLFLGFGVLLLISTGQNKDEGSDVVVKKDAQSIEGAKQYLASIRNNQHTGLLNPRDVIKSRAQKENIATKSGEAIEYTWESLGPDNIGGRTRALIFDNRDAQAKTLYAGSVSGGIFKSTNLGSDWQKVNLGSGTANLNVTSMVQTSDGTIYVGTGEGLSTENYSVTGDFGYEGGFVGKGLFKSDNNDNFYLVPGTAPVLTEESADWAYINEIAIDTKGNRLFVATQNGLKYANFPNLDNWQSEFKYRVDSNMVNRQISVDSVIVCDSFDIDNGNFVFYGSLGWQSDITVNDTTNVELLSREFKSFETYGNCYDVKVSPEGTLITTFNNSIYISENGDPTNMVNSSVYPENATNIRKDNITWSAHYMIKNKSGNIIYDSTSQSLEVTNWHIDYYYPAPSTIEQYPTSIDAGRTEFAIAPSASNVIYAMVAKGTSPNKNRLMGIYRSVNSGKNWTTVAPGGSTSLNILGSKYGTNTAYYQGDFCNTLVVFPTDPYKILAGGINMWMGQKITEIGYYQWGKVSTAEAYLLINGIFDAQYCHMDHHAYVFRPGVNNELFVGTDGGMFKANTLSTSVSFQSINKNYSTAQFYSVAVSNLPNEYIGGTQDNGSLYNSGITSTGISAVDMWRASNFPTSYPTGTDGGSVALSNIRIDYSDDDDVAPPSFYSKSPLPNIQEGLQDRMRRSETLGYDFSLNFLSGDLENDAFITPMVLWESYNNENSRDSIKYIATTNLAQGDTIVVRSKIYGHPFDYFMPHDLVNGDSIMIQDIFSTKLFIATEDAIWMTLESHRFELTPAWWEISNAQHAGFAGIPMSLAVSSDGNYLYVGNDEGRLFKLSNIALAYDEVRADVGSSECIISTQELIISEGFTQAVTSISVDPKDNNKVLVTLGNYGNTDYVYYCTNAVSDDPVFTSVQGNLPAMPVYSCLLEMDEDSDIALLGTEMGIWASDNAGSGNWYAIAPEIGDVQVMDLMQQSIYKRSFTLTYYDPVTEIPYYEVYPEVKNYGHIYAATYGRGVFHVAINDYVGIDESHETASKQSIQFEVYPNPSVAFASISFYLVEKADVEVQIYNLSGQRVFTQKFSSVKSGSNEIPVDVQKLTEGTYIVQLTSGNTTGTNKIVVVK
ncbi:MAG: T9SS type A sorting domain-containing protein [Bacteroidales bacterium]